MNTITNLQNKFNNTNNEKNKSTKKTSFEIRKEHFAKDLANLTFNPRFKHTYKLNKKYRNLQLGSRVTIAALAAAIGIGVGIGHSVTNPEPSQPLNQEAVLNDAEQLLLKIVYGDELKDVVNPDIKYKYQNSDGHTTVSVVSSDETQYSYTNDILSKLNNSADITEFLNQMIIVEGKSTNASQGNLKKLDDLTEEIGNKNYILKNSHSIIDNEPEQDLEID